MADSNFSILRRNRLDGPALRSFQLARNAGFVTVYSHGIFSSGHYSCEGRPLFFFCNAVMGVAEMKYFGALRGC